MINALYINFISSYFAIQSTFELTRFDNLIAEIRKIRY